MCFWRGLIWAGKQAKHTRFYSGLWLVLKGCSKRNNETPTAEAFSDVSEANDPDYVWVNEKPRFGPEREAQKAAYKERFGGAGVSQDSVRLKGKEEEICLVWTKANNEKKRSILWLTLEMFARVISAGLLALLRRRSAWRSSKGSDASRRSGFCGWSRVEECKSRWFFHGFIGVLYIWVF